MFLPQFLKPRRSIPLQLLAAGGATVILTTIALLLAWHAYAGTREVLLSSVDESTRHLSMVLKDRVRGILEPAESQITLLAEHEVVEANTLEQRLAALPTARAALLSNPLLDALYVAYPDGGFVLFRALRDPNVRRVFRAPAESELFVQTQTPQADGQLRGEFRYYDAHGALLRQTRREDYVFDARTRPWYRAALTRQDSVLVDPYVFFTTRSVGTTLARHAKREGVVIGLDLTIDVLAREIAELRITPGARVVITDNNNRLLVRDRGSLSELYGRDGDLSAPEVRDVEIPALAAAAELPKGELGRLHRKVAQQDWELVSVPLQMRSQNKPLRVLMAIPHEELFRDARKLLGQQLLVTLLLILASIPAGVWITRQISAPLRALTEETSRLAAFNFAPSKPRASMIAEVELLARATQQMKATMARFLDVSAALNSEKRLERLLDVVLGDVAESVQARSGALYLYEVDSGKLRRAQQLSSPQARASHPAELSAERFATHPAVRALQDRHSVVGVETGSEQELVAVPLENLGKEFVGVLVLELPSEIDAKHSGGRDAKLAFIEALSSTAAVAIETRHLVDSQKNLLEALIQLLAGAIDAKSPYTGSHCQRVPELTKMLARAAHEARSGPYRDFTLSEEDWEAVHVGAWLHDCGKITTPEAVVDKATKLETTYNRIHEIRTRFEVLKRDAEIHYWRSRSQGTPDDLAWAELQQRWRSLDEDFSFVAACNLGSESLDQDKIARLRQIGARTWMRTFDDRLGLSREELRNLQEVPVRATPAAESLLADKPEHLLRWLPGERIADRSSWGFASIVPRYKFNRGELYNLGIQRGTLTDEERFIVNDHIAQTIIMLQRLPFPRHLRSVPEIAGGHHERMDGRGYPRGLVREQMSVPARIMAIADVFEALTAADRPYKAAKTLSESLLIMAHMVREQHLDPDLFELFLRAGVWRDYAEKFLAPSQLDSVDIDAIMTSAHDDLLSADLKARFANELDDVS
ncbi:HD domain-containing phosphohydrolase [Uliginosibacterium sediminicola]|uniref:HD domain-containing phosphohydrolase n=1 Tax=Uliginosibacterium sediminicola TaxID=2024550 RepID=A0ABU9YX17_9RHOO